MSKTLEGNQTKKAHQKIEYDDEMLEDLRNCNDPETGYMYFIQKYGSIKHPSRGRIIYKPFDYQVKLLHVYHNYRFSVNMLGRQMGKCVIGDSIIKVKNKHTDEILEIPIKKFHEIIKENKNN